VVVAPRVDVVVVDSPMELVVVLPGDCGATEILTGEATIERPTPVILRWTS